MGTSPPAFGGWGAGRFFRAEEPPDDDREGDGGGFTDKLVKELFPVSSSSSKSLPNGFKLVRGGLGGPMSGVPLGLMCEVLGNATGGCCISSSESSHPKGLVPSTSLFGSAGASSTTSSSSASGSSKGFRVSG
jgi:hypothetical protein